MCVERKCSQRWVASAARFLAFCAFIFSADLLMAAEMQPPVACRGDQECRAVKVACEEQYRRNDCSDLRPSPGVVLSPQEACYVDAARRRCGQFDKALARCLLGGHPGIAGGCWHLSPGFPFDIVDLGDQRFVCETNLPEAPTCRGLSATDSREGGK